MLLIMQVLTVRKKKANVFFDYGSNKNFVKESFAKESGFKGRKEDLNVTTLGNVVTDIQVMAYQCTLRDVDGNMEVFEAYDMESITGALTQISESQIRELFPHLSGKSIKQLLRGETVDFLIGMCHASWHPERLEQAPGDGDLWIYGGKYGKCLGGRLPGVKETTR